MSLEHTKPNISLSRCGCADSDTIKENLILSVDFKITVKANLGMRECWKSSSCLLMHRLTTVKGLSLFLKTGLLSLSTTSLFSHKMKSLCFANHH